MRSPRRTSPSTTASSLKTLEYFLKSASLWSILSSSTHLISSCNSLSFPFVRAYITSPLDWCQFHGFVGLFQFFPLAYPTFPGLLRNPGLPLGYEVC